MAGASGSGEDIESGRVNRAESDTVIWAQVPPGQANFGGPAILIVETAKDAEDPDDYDEGEHFVPSNNYHGLIARGHSKSGLDGGSPPAHGVLGRGGNKQGTGVVGLGGGTSEPGEPGGEGGIGVHGLGGWKDNYFPDPAVVPGAGMVAQGGRQSVNYNTDRQPHAAGLIAISGGNGAQIDILPEHPLTETGGIGVYGQGAELTITMVPPSDESGNSIEGPKVPSGPAVPGAGVLGRGGKNIPAEGPAAAGVIGLASGVTIPSIAETGNAGIYGAGAMGVVGNGITAGVRGKSDERGRGGVFESARSAQVQLVPHKLKQPIPNQTAVTVSAVPTEGSPALPKDALGGDLMVIETETFRNELELDCTLWFCVRGRRGSQPARWAQVLVGPSFDGLA